MASLYSKRQIRAAGNALAAGNLSDAEREQALHIIGHWRAAHIEPLHKTLSILERVCEQDEDTVLVSRLKRIETTINKLRRPEHNFILTTLRDIAGCRLIVPTEEDVRQIASDIWATGQCHGITKDYMTNPKDSGYRGIHLVCRHNSEAYGYENLNVEVQVRSRRQHDWATAVEIYDLVTGADLKSGFGSRGQKRYFQLVADLLNDDAADRSTMIKELGGLDEKLHVLNTLREAMNSMYIIYNSDLEISRTDSCLITVDVGLQQITLDVFPDCEEAAAADRYTELESTAQDGLLYLLARAGSLEDLRRAYPNYYSDVSSFVDWLGGQING